MFLMFLKLLPKYSPGIWLCEAARAQRGCHVREVIFTFSPGRDSDKICPVLMQIAGPDDQRLFVQPGQCLTGGQWKAVVDVVCDVDR